jgi:hypothetical protein
MILSYNIQAGQAGRRPPEINFGHTHAIHVNPILCSPRAREFAAMKLFPRRYRVLWPGLRLRSLHRPGLEALPGYPKRDDKSPRGDGHSTQCHSSRESRSHHLGTHRLGREGRMFMADKAAQSSSQRLLLAVHSSSPKKVSVAASGVPMNTVFRVLVFAKRPAYDFVGDAERGMFASSGAWKMRPREFHSMRCHAQRGCTTRKKLIARDPQISRNRLLSAERFCFSDEPLGVTV